MACKNRRGEIFIIYENIQKIHQCWLILGSAYDKYIGAYIFNIKTLYDPYEEVPNNSYDQVEVSYVSVLARRKSTRVVRFDDL